jgi:ethanolamine utilization protein EutA
MMDKAKIMFEDLYKSESITSEKKSFNSVGIDIGSTTTQLVFSKLTLGFIEEKHKYDIVEREITYLSKISLTPFDTSYNIDIEGLSNILSMAYKNAGYSSEDIDTGAIIITGVAALRHNAERILKLFSDQMGKFVCATAGPNYEAILAAHGSGAVELSERRLKTVMNIDVGGGTTKIAVVKKGDVIDTAAIYVGARHIVLDDEEKLVRVEEPAKIVATASGFDLEIGKNFPDNMKKTLASILADCLFQVISNDTFSPLTEKLMQTPPLSFRVKPDLVVFSGGVSEYIYGYELESFGDLGIILGEEIRRRMFGLDTQVVEPVERIRATVIGESQYTLQVSGTTNLITSSDLLPIRNLSVVAPIFTSSVLTQEEIEEEIKKAIEMHDLDIALDPFALAFRRSVINQPSYKLMKKVSEAVITVLEGKVKIGGTVILVFEADIGMGIGRVIIEEIAPDLRLISIDEIRLGDFNYIDIGEPSGERGFIPVIIKSLVFPNQVKID